MLTAGMTAVCAIASSKIKMSEKVTVRTNLPRIAELRTLLLASFGGALEFYDFIIFVFFAGVIGNLFFSPRFPDWVRQLQTFGIFAAGYFARPLGGIVMAHFGDTRGRKRMFMLSVVLMAFPTLVIGLLPTYQSIGITAPLLLLAMRLLQGIAIGGEAPGAWVFVAEHARRDRVGLAIGLLTSGLSCGIMLGSLITTAITLGFTPAQITSGLWRVPFVIGGIFGFIAMLLRRWLQETPVFEQIQRRAMVSRELPLRTILRSHRLAIVSSVVSTWMLTAVIVVVILMTPSLLQNVFRLSPRDVQLANLAGTAVLCLSTFATAVATDRFGVRRVTLALLPLLVIATYALYIGAERVTVGTASALYIRRCRCGRRGACTPHHGSRISFPGPFLRCFIPLQHIVCGFRRPDPRSRVLACTPQSTQSRALHRSRYHVGLSSHSKGTNYRPLHHETELNGDTRAMHNTV